jgi:hypothetical protein
MSLMEDFRSWNEPMIDEDAEKFGAGCWLIHARPYLVNR